MGLITLAIDEVLIENRVHAKGDTVSAELIGDRRLKAMLASGQAVRGEIPPPDPESFQPPSKRGRPRAETADLRSKLDKLETAAD